MSETVYSSKASFVNGHYRIGANLSPRSMRIAAVHEEAHGIIRRSTPYGLLLSQIHAPDSTLAADNILAHGLLSRGRTSEEVYATFSSITGAIWGGDEAAPSELNDLPEYAYYHDIGTELADTIETSFFKIYVLEGIVRFCWSSQHIAEFVERSLPWSDVRSLPVLAYPDHRMSRLRTDWPQIGLKLWAAVEQRYSDLVERARTESFSEFWDPLGHKLKKLIPEGFTFIGDMGPEFARLRNEMIRSRAEVSEWVAMFVADYLTEQYDGTPMAARYAADLIELIESKRKEVGSHATLIQSPEKASSKDNSWDHGSKQQPLHIIESVVNFDKKRRVKILPKLQRGRTRALPLVGVRSWQSFTDNFELPDELQATRNAEAEAMYATPYSLVPSSQHTSLKDRRLPLALHPGWDVKSAPTLAEWVPPPAIVAVWTSFMLQDPDLWPKYFRNLAFAGYSLWLLADTEPVTVVRTARRFLPEVNGFFHAPLESRPNLGGLVLRGLGDMPDLTAQPVRGLIFPGLQHTLQNIMAMLRREMGDDFRGMNGLEITASAAGRRHEGQAVVAWLIANEHTFSYSR
jgi:hypothetical protein